MVVHFRFLFVVFAVTAILLFTVFLRSEQNRLFYRVCTLNREQSRLEQQLWLEQLRLESMINPAGLSRRMGK